jgi:N-acetylmuramoyl-L-alanine amidase
MPKAMRACAGRTGTHGLRAFALCLLLVLLAPVAAVAAKGAAKSGNPVDAPVRKLLTLLTRKDTSATSLKRVEAEIDAARSARPDGENGAKGTFFLARAQEEIARRSGSKADWARPAETFGTFIDRFPKHHLAAEALYRRGLLRMQRLGDPDGAADDFQTVLKNHPASSRAGQAKRMLRSVAKAGPPVTPAKPAQPSQKSDPEPQPRQPAQAADTPTLLGVRLKNHPQNARVVLDLESKVRYKYQQLGEDRVYIDLLGTDLGPGMREDQTLSGGLLKHIRVAERDKGFVRVVLDFTSLRDYKVQTLDSPFRIVLDATSGRQPIKPLVDADKDDTPAKAERKADPPAEQTFTAPKGRRKKLAADLVEQLGLSVRTVMVDAGHGGKDPGARGFGLQEKDIALRMALTLGKELKKRGFRVLYTRTTDDFLALEERTALANSKKADLFLSVHCNAHTDPSIHGLETFSLNLARTPDEVRVAARENSVSDKNISDLQMILTDLMLTSKIKESVELARGVHSHGLAAIRGKWSVTDHGTREAPFYVLMGAKMPSALIEIGYITNKVESARLNSDAYLKILACGIADGVEEYKKQIERYAARQGKK